MVNRELPYINKRPLRAEKLGKGRRSIRRQHYQIRPKDLIEYDGQSYLVNGVQNKGTRVVIYMGDDKKSVAIKKIKCLHHTNGVLIRKEVSTAFIS